MPGTGGCLCGGVRYVIDGPLRDVIVCHCSRCRRTHGGAAPYSRCTEADLTIEGEALSWYVVDERERGFCTHCGASLFWKVSGSDTVSVAAGSIDPPTGLRTVGHIHLEEAGDYEEDLPAT
jgi:hypothetical protein